MKTQQYQQQSKHPDIVKITVLFIGLGVSAYVTYAISRHLMKEITEQIEI